MFSRLPWKGGQPCATGALEIIFGHQAAAAERPPENMFERQDASFFSGSEARMSMVEKSPAPR
jgi:hypothetical protein